jgi:hypothetical protein
MISSKLATAEEAVRAALIYALEKKRDNFVPQLFDLLNKVREVKESNNDYVFSLNTNNIPGYSDMTTTPETIDYLNGLGNIKISTTNSSDVITFGS